MPRTVHGLRTKSGWIARSTDRTDGIIVPVLESAPITIADVGDRVQARCHRGGGYNADSIHQGGQWVQLAGTVVRRFGDGCATVEIEWDDGVTSLTSPIFDERGFPTSNMTLVQS